MEGVSLKGGGFESGFLHNFFFKQVDGFWQVLVYAKHMRLHYFFLCSS